MTVEAPPRDDEGLALALPDLEEIREPARAKLLAGSAALSRSALEDASALLAEARELARREGDSAAELEIYHEMGMLAVARELRPGDVTTYVALASRLYRDDRPFLIAEKLWMLGREAQKSGDDALAVTQLTLAGSYFRQAERSDFEILVLLDLLAVHADGGICDGLAQVTDLLDSKLIEVDGPGLCTAIRLHAGLCLDDWRNLRRYPKVFLRVLYEAGDAYRIPTVLTPQPSKPGQFPSHDCRTTDEPTKGDCNDER